MPYGTIKVDTITFTSGSSDVSVAISGLVQNPTFSGDVTVTGTVSGTIVRGNTVSGATVTGTAGQFGTLTGNTAGFTTVTGTTVTGTTANFVTVSGNTLRTITGIFASGSAANPSITFSGDLDTGLFTGASNTVGIAANGAAVLTVSGTSVGVGTGSPGDVLHVEGTIRTSSGSNNAQFANNFLRSNQAGTFFFDQNSGSQDFAFRVSNLTNLDTTAMTIKSSGRVGIGTTSPGSQLGLSGATGATHGIQLNANGWAYTNRIGVNGTSGDELIISQNWNAATNTVDSASYGTTFIRGDTSNGSLAFGTGPGNTVPTTKLFINNSGAVGIGITSPTGQLSLQETTAPTLDFYTGATKRAIIKSTNAIFDFNALTGNDITFTCDTSERMRLTTAGRLGIGITNPAYPLHVLNNGEYGSGTLSLSPRSAGGGASYILMGNNDSGGTAGPNVIYAANRILGIGVGTSFTDAGGGTFTEYVRIDAEGRVQVGTSAPSIGSPLLHVQGSKSTNGLANFANNTNSGDVNHGIINLINTATGATGNDARIMFTFRQAGATSGLDPMASLGAVKESGDYAAAIQFNTRSASSTFSEKARITAGGTLLVGVTSANANGGILQLSQGITFPATAVAATDANTLDDYEEGTWTAELKFSSSTTGSLNYTGQVGRYIKIGGLVFISVFIAWNQNNITANSGTLGLHGLPFTTGSVNAQRGGFTITYTNNPFSGLTIYQMAIRTEAALTRGQINISTSTAGDMDTEISSYTNLTAGGDFMLAGCYSVL